MKRTFGMAVCILLICLAARLHAQPGMKDPHEGTAATTGVIVGTLYDEDNKPLGQHKVVLEIFHEKNMILAIPKNTAPDGAYRFKNIFQRPGFSYFVTTRYRDGLYSTPAVKLRPGEKERKVDLVIGAESKVEERSAQPMPHAHGSMVKEKSWWPFDVYQTLAILLSIAAIVYVLFLIRRKSKPHV